MRRQTEAAEARTEPDLSKAAVSRRRKQAAKRALAEAEERRLASQPTPLAKEAGGRAGPEPTRYGDWEKKGIASDF